MDCLTFRETINQRGLRENSISERDTFKVLECFLMSIYYSSSLFCGIKKSVGALRDVFGVKTRWKFMSSISKVFGALRNEFPVFNKTTISQLTGNLFFSKQKTSK